ncbi:LysR substrate-binding domain-containing protein [Paenibacillus doosanensis]|uniref:HTH-type transcriptional activator CmpR n=1 Tax=Paenibacillus konkukensis TaxID=2020716 RepID=A0ABY4RHP1_9BACL|nr:MULTISPECIES: LysR substrate-binding domain-containing protein [Paenibacillus]MCS7463841.1 LysR substrate-binding domain-containing protein [Paenibacillus doosanensis]UQZ81149.1 HTH-type transcriptional activator CmpR [Paenibacillus konkukensis]
MNINLLKLQIVELLERHKKITAVAEALGLKQPTITFHMKSLEQELGVSLFEHRSGKVHLTEAGKSLFHYSVKINSLAQEAARVVKEFDQLGRGSLKIGASYVPGTYMLPRILSEFARAYPRISLSLMIRTAPVIKELILNHEIDLGIISCEPFQLPPLLSETLCEDELVLIMSPQHGLARQPQLYPDQLEQVPFLLHSPESSTRQLTAKWAQSNRIELRGQMEFDSLEAIKQTVMLGEGVSFVSRLAVRKEVERGELLVRQIPQNSYNRYVYVAFNEDRSQSAVLDEFIGHLRREVPE